MAVTHMRRCEERLLASGPAAMWRPFGLSAPQNTLHSSTTQTHMRTRFSELPLGRYLEDGGGVIGGIGGLEST